MVNTSSLPLLSESTTGLVTFQDKYTASDFTFGLVIFSLSILLLVVGSMLWVSLRKKRISRKGHFKIPLTKRKRKEKPVAPTGPNMYDQSIKDWLEKK